jgi:hypothetical protein
MCCARIVWRQRDPPGADAELEHGARPRERHERPDGRVDVGGDLRHGVVHVR